MSEELEQDRHQVDLGEDLNGVDEKGTYIEAGNDPFGDANPGSCNADATECDVVPHVLDGPPERSEVPVIEEAMEAYVGEPTVFGVSPEDGLPVPINDSDLHEAPTIRYDNHVCLEDARQYVEMFIDEIPYPWGADRNNATDLLGGLKTLNSRGRYDDKGVLRERRTYEPSEVKTAFGVSYVIISHGDLVGEGFVFVRPIRPKCEHYRRQILNNDAVPEGEKDHQIVFRNCTIRRSVGGAFMTLRDQSVFACEYRSPPDPVSAAEHIDGPEKKRLERAAVRLPMFTKPAVPLPDYES